MLLTQYQHNKGVNISADHLVPGADEVIHLVREVLAHVEERQPVK